MSEQEKVLTKSDVGLKDDRFIYIQLTKDVIGPHCTWPKGFIMQQKRRSERAKELLADGHKEVSRAKHKAAVDGKQRKKY